MQLVALETALIVSSAIVSLTCSIQEQTCHYLSKNHVTTDGVHLLKGHSRKYNEKVKEPKKLELESVNKDLHS